MKPRKLRAATSNLSSGNVAAIHFIYGLLHSNGGGSSQFALYVEASRVLLY